MPNYDYKCKKCKHEYNVNHSIKLDAFKEYHCPECDSVQKCERLISPNCCEIAFKGDGWTIKSAGFGKRGYKGKFGNLIREKDTPVDSPTNKNEADRFFQQQIDRGMLDGVKPSVSVEPRTAEQSVDKKYTPKYNR